MNNCGRGVQKYTKYSGLCIKLRKIQLKAEYFWKYVNIFSKKLQKNTWHCAKAGI